MARPLSMEDEKWISITAESIENMFPIGCMPESKNLDYLQWSHESYQIAIQIAYQGIQPNVTLSSEYLASGQHTALRQIALAGYRLAELIKEIIKE
jgi:S1/P1 Nuclease